MSAELIVLRLIHILCGIYWVGSAVFFTFFLMPSLQESGTVPQVMAGLGKRKFMVMMPVMALLTILAGVRLMWILAAGNPGWFSSSSGMVYSVSGGLAILALISGLIFSRPAGIRMTQIAQQLAAGSGDRAQLTAEMSRLQKKAGITGMLATVVIVLSAAGMAVARYV